MILNNQYAVVISVNNTLHSAIKGNLPFTIFFLQHKSEKDFTFLEKFDISALWTTVGYEFIQEDR